MKHGLPFKFAGALGLIFLVHSTWAVTPQLPGSVQPSQVGAALKAQHRAPQPEVLPPLMQKPQQAPNAVSSEAQKIKFRLNAIIVDDNTVITDEELRPIYADKLHKMISIKELFEIVQGLTNYYRNKGYILTRAILPPQHVHNGVVHIRIIEGYVGNVIVQGKPRGACCMIIRYGNRIKSCPPLHLARLERYLLLANEIPGTQVKAVLSPSKKQLGAADLTLVSENHPVTGFASYDNYGTRYIGPQQMTANIALNSGLMSGDALTATFTKTPKGKELTYGDINYNTPIDCEGTRWILGYTRVHTHPLFVLRPAEIDGVNTNIYTTMMFPAIRTRSESLTYRVGFNYLDSDVRSLDQRLYMDHVRSLDFGASWNFSDVYYGTNMLSGDFRVGLPILGYSSDQNPDTAQVSRPGGRGDYAKVTAQLSRLQMLFSSWSLYGVFQGQWAFNPLLASEQFTFGGSQLGRGYDVAELIGDKGMAGSLELRYDIGFNRVLQTLQLYGYYDLGVIYNFKLIGGVPRQQSGSSAGLGARLVFTKYLTANVMWTQVLTKPVAAEQIIGRGYRSRVFFSLVATIS